MGIFDFLTGEFIDVIHWTDDTRDTMVWRFEREGHEIKYGAKLTVREGQAAVFVHEGQLADVFTPGLYMLETNNMPVMTTLQHWDHGFQSPFKSEVYFVNTTRFNDLKWGTKNPIMCRDPEFGPVRIRAFGSYAMRVADPGIRRGEYGVLTLLSNGTYAYVLDDCSSKVQGLGAGETVTETFNYLASDGTQRSDGALTVTVQGTNDTPDLVRCLSDVQLAKGKAFSWQLPAGSFKDADRNDTLAYTATLSNGKALPSWLKFDAATKRLLVSGVGK
ncbi:MAG: SPFH domain-containing protein, partial [Jhaorihella sp.]